MNRPIRFLRSLARMRKHRIPWTKGNMRAAWMQTEPGWLSKAQSAFLDMTDEEVDSYMAALEEQQ